LVKYWMAVGSQENWSEAFQNGNIWGLTKRQQHIWEAITEKDVIVFYVTKPVAGIIGFGTIQTKFRQDQPLWSDEIKEEKVIWPLRLEFDVDYCLASDAWTERKVTSDTIKLKAGTGFREIDSELGKQIVNELIKPTDIQTAGEYSHKELQDKIVEIGRLQKYIAEKEYNFDIGKLDAVWRRIERSVPTYVFEIQIGGDIYHALAKLKHAYDLWNSKLFLVASQADHDKATNLLSGTFHEIGGRVKFIDLPKIEELYMRKKAYLDFEKQLGI